MFTFPLWLSLFSSSSCIWVQFTHNLGYQHRVHNNPTWQVRLKVTDASFTALLEYCIRKYEKAAPNFRRKYSKESLEDVCLQANLLVALLTEVKAEFPIEDHTIENMLGCWFDGDVNLELCLQNAIHNKDPDFHPRDVPMINEAVQKHTANAPAMLKPTNVTAMKLEVEEFQLFLRKGEWDLQANHVYAQQLVDRTTAAYFAKKRHENERHGKCLNAVQGLFRPDSPHCRFVFEVYAKKSQDNVAIIDNHFKMFAKNMHLCVESLTPVCLFNSAAPCLLNAEHKRLAQDMLATLCNKEDAFGIGIVIDPQFTEQKGKVWKQKASMHEALNKGGLNTDNKFVLLYSGRADARSDRP